MKKCSKCGEVKPATEYGKDKQRPDGVRHWCKACTKTSTSMYRESNPGKRKEADFRYRQANPEKNIASCAKWRAANKMARRILDNNRNARKREVGGKLSQGLAERLFKLQRGKCACGCMQPLGENYQLDHRMPVALGGANEDWNIQLLRATCNQQKHAKHPIDFMQSRGFLV